MRRSAPVANVLPIGATSSPRRLGPFVLATCLVLPLLAANMWTGYRVGLPDAVLGFVTASEQPLSIREPGAWWAAGVVLLWCGLAYSRRAPVVWWAALLVALGAVASLLRTGNLWLLGVALIVPLGRQLSALEVRGRSGSRLAAPGVGALSIGAALLLALIARPSSAPPEAIAAARQAPPAATVLADWRWAGDLQRQLGDQRHVLAAGGLLAEPGSFWIDYLRIARGYEHAEDVLNTYGVSVVVLDSRDQAAQGAQLIRDSADWRTIFDASGALVAQHE